LIGRAGERTVDNDTTKEVFWEEINPVKSGIILFLIVVRLLLLDIIVVILYFPDSP
jgi:hypothetical protein